MYVIMVYDVNKKRVQKVLKTARKYLKWVQKSVFEGKITEKNLKKLRDQLLELINQEEDSIYWYIMEPEFKPYRKILGKSENISNLI
ncbi:CRISPR-associated protein Cas2 [Thermosipho melanesiensis]|uniref:CRISPR-associated endoribonuclease Cas2 n=2 Tax=Thermosipho melanesiensis TaxID=46541 RepID=A6LNJ3_THEM4|nr:CRISPR-associated endonuclease Cas2 [Thermosipho melanesiensis]ABR31494.1 CRISPR-associated protein Cas2 [Thermosipho melanesiensis BI429]APT74551.1 CRISPR-associated protein Cas2 [Thermosipho melanesiensis]OOC35465.1 CRISPR-associated protein Cas2 [Thermosipho melanesiensis]OOC36502.1 CRISPR-associated protein Cas2 [Thermosipho melanesiensis]OOC36825.1 CRISPR-associated protein Cas2 [Thermosipho melanesiensis]